MKPENIKEAATSDLNQAHIFYVKRIEKENFDRVVKLKRMRQRNIWTGLGLAGSVLGICILFPHILYPINHLT